MRLVGLLSAFFFFSFLLSSLPSFLPSLLPYFLLSFLLSFPLSFFPSFFLSFFPSPYFVLVVAYQSVIYRRWLTHSISDYYGLESKSVMVGSPARRVVYVGVKQKQQQGVRHKPPIRPVLPPPLWEMF